MKKIVIVRGNEFKVYDGEIDRSEDIFEDLYQKARKHRKDLERYTEKMILEEQDREKERPSEYLNNIIAFCGERGQGKSTAMQHFVQELRQDREKEILRVIDPTAMEMAHDMVDIIISQLFAQFRGNREKNESWDMNLTQAFQKVHRNMSVLKNAQKFIEREYAYNSSLQNLSDITDSMEMRADIMNLIARYLEWKKKKMLVIPIDDLDLNLNHVYQVAEQLRKYFMIPRIMIVMAVNISQLTLCVERELLDNLAPLKESDRWNIQREARNMSSRYMEKLIPFSRRMQLPDIHAIAEDGKNAVEIIYRNDHHDNADWKPDVMDLDIVELASGMSVSVPMMERIDPVIFATEELGIEKGILNLIFERTGLVYVARPNEIHPIVPSTLRELVNLISLLGDMGRDQVKNLETFERYFCHVWLENNLSEQSASLVRKIAETQLNDLHNDTFLLLYEIQKGKIEGSPKGFGDMIIEPLRGAVYQVYKAMLNGAGIPDNGDLFNCFRLLCQGEKSDRSRLVMAVMTVFSVQMLKLKAEKKWEVLYDFIGQNLFGEISLIRRKAVRSGRFGSRMEFDYQVKVFMEDIAGQPLPSSVGEIRKVVDQNVLARVLVLMGISSEFKKADGTPRKLVSDNYQLSERAVFNLNLLFQSAISLERIKEKVSLDKWGIAEEIFRAEYDKIYQSDGWTELVCNMEELFCLAQDVEENREINDAAMEADYYSHFFNSIKQFLEALQQYMGSLDTMEEIDIEEWGKWIALMKPNSGEDAGSRENRSSENHDSVPTASPEKKNTLPSCRKDTKWNRMEDNLKQIRTYMDKHRDEIPGVLFDELFKEWTSLYALSQVSSPKEEIGREVADRYNQLRKDVFQ